MTKSCHIKVTKVIQNLCYKLLQLFNSNSVPKYAFRRHTNNTLTITKFLPSLLFWFKISKCFKFVSSFFLQSANCIWVFIRRADVVQDVTVHSVIATVASFWWTDSHSTFLKRNLIFTHLKSPMKFTHLLRVSKQI